MLETLARLGYVSKAVMYTIVGLLALAAAVGTTGGRITDLSGALKVVLRQPYGRALLFVLALGLCGYAVWRILDAIRDPDRHGTKFNGMVTRVGNLVRALIYGGLGIEAFSLFRGLGGSDGREAQTWSARLMDMPMGVPLLVILGSIVVVYGVSEIVASFKGGYSKTLDISVIPAHLRRLADRTSRVGIGARGVIIVVLGIFLVRAALQHDPSEAHGQRGSIMELAQLADGPWILAFVGLGFLAYAVDQAIHAWCRRIAPVT
jgi:hypothetical protein